MPLTVDRLFEILIRAEETADSVSVDWDERFGYPTRIQIDYSDAIDDEVTYRVIRFRSGG